MKYHQKYRRQENLMKYFFDYATLFLTQNTIEKWTKGWMLPFPKKSDLGSTKNYRGITLTAIIGLNVHYFLILNRIKPEIEKIPRKSQHGFRRNRFTTSQILTFHRILEGLREKNLKAILLSIDFSKWLTKTQERWLSEFLLSCGCDNTTVWMHYIFVFICKEVSDL